MMRHRHGLQILALWIALCAIVMPAAGINLVVDYDTYDTSDFFGAGNPQDAGAQARAALGAAADYFSHILNDTLAAITVPDTYESTVFDGEVDWYWRMAFDHPSTGAEIKLENPPLAADEYIIYAGARSYTGNTAGQGGPGGLEWGRRPTGSFTSEEIDELEQIHDNFEQLVQKRGESSGFARWGGTISFDTSSRVWHYDHTTPPSGNVTDFYSVAVHELAHALGFGSAQEWQSLVSGSYFTGVNAQSKYGGPVPLSGDQAHWAPGTSSVLYGGNTPQETAMDPDLTNGTRKRLTELDAAAMRDIGWELIPPPALHGDYNNNGIVDAADYAVWRDKLGQSVTILNDATPGSVTQADYTLWRSRFGQALGAGSGTALAAVPEPTSAVLACLCGAVFWFSRRKRRR